MGTQPQGDGYVMVPPAQQGVGGTHNNEPKEPKQLFAFPGIFTFGMVNFSSKGKEYFTGYFKCKDSSGTESSYKATCFRSSVCEDAKKLGAYGDNKTAIQNLPVIVHSEGFKQNTQVGSKSYGKFEIIFDSWEIQDANIVQRLAMTPVPQIGMQQPQMGMPGMGVPGVPTIPGMQPQMQAPMGQPNYGQPQMQAPMGQPNYGQPQIPGMTGYGQ
jgi:hypothetical protein